MNHIFSSPKKMFRRARQLIADLEREIQSFSQDKPWAIVAELDSDGVTDEFKVKFTRRLSDDLPNILFDAVNNLRSALDQVAFAVAVRHTGSDHPQSAKFPFSTTEPKLLDHAKGACKDLPPEITSLFISLRPYKGGNDVLWAVNELCNAPKHKMVYPVDLAGGNVIIRPKADNTSFLLSPDGQFERFEFFPPRWDGAKNELVFGYMPSRLKFQGEFEVSFTIVLGDVDESIRDMHPVAILNEMARVVEGILMTTEAECRRIGLII